MEAFIRDLRDVQPCAFVVENVQGFVSEGLQWLREALNHVNAQTGTRYSLHWKVLNAADFGVPQCRKRLLVIGARHGESFSFPQPTHGPHGSQPHVCTWDAIADLPEPSDDACLHMSGKWASLT